MSEQQVRDLVTQWYQLLDIHAPVGDLLPLLAQTGLEMQFPEGPLQGLDDFKRWYETVTHTFFDEVHLLKEVNVTMKGDRSEVELVVNWQASRWTPPLAKSDRLAFDAYQRWTVVRGPDGTAVVLNYIVDKLQPMAGSAPLEGSVALWPR